MFHVGCIEQVGWMVRMDGLDGWMDGWMKWMDELDEMDV